MKGYRFSILTAMLFGVMAEVALLGAEVTGDAWWAEFGQLAILATAGVMILGAAELAWRHYRRYAAEVWPDAE